MAAPWMKFHWTLNAIGVLLYLLPSSLTAFFSLNKPNEKGIVDFPAFLARTELPVLGCEVYAVAITSILKFYDERAARRERLMLLKTRRC
uniref:Putative secreted protein n=1 Tax=Ixodes ricinus TaxID=34613 RepID=A0A6B0U3B9_IXORI